MGLTFIKDHNPYHIKETLKGERSIKGREEQGSGHKIQVCGGCGQSPRTEDQHLSGNQEIIEICANQVQKLS